MRGVRVVVATLVVAACGSPASTPPPARAVTLEAGAPEGTGVGMAPPGNAAAAVTPWIGIALAPGTRGARVSQVLDDAPGARAGLLIGDEVVAIDAVTITTPRELIDTVAAKGVGTRIALALVRGGAAITVQLALEAKPEMLEILRRKVVDKPVPATPLLDAYGPYPVGRLAEHAGKVVIVELGASWCGFCRSTLPTLERWQREHGAAGLRVVWISAEEIDVIRAIDPAITGVTRARDPEGAFAAAVGSSSLPTFLVVDRAGVVRMADVGAGDETLARIAALSQQLLAAP